MNYLLFTTTRCPKCPEIKKFIAEHVTIPGRILDETTPDFAELVAEFSVASAPSFLVFENGQELFRGNEISEMQDFIGKLKE